MLAGRRRRRTPELLGFLAAQARAWIERIRSLREAAKQ